MKKISFAEATVSILTSCYPQFFYAYKYFETFSRDHLKLRRGT